MRNLMIVLLALMCSYLRSADAPENTLLGAWQNDTDKTYVLHFTEKKLAWSQPMGLQLGMTRYVKDGVHIRIFGRKPMVWGTVVEGDKLTLNAGGTPSLWTRMKEVPQGLDYAPLKLGNVVEVEAEEAKSIRDQLNERQKLLDAMAKDPLLTTGHLQTLKETNEFLRKTATELGWIDARRFGKDTANLAMTLLQKGKDIPLILAALPVLEKDASAKLIDTMTFARFYDQVQLSLANPQRYGTQVYKNDKDEIILFPLEDPARVDELRQKLGIGEVDKNFKFQE